MNLRRTLSIAILLIALTTLAACDLGGTPPSPTAVSAPTQTPILLTTPEATATGTLPPPTPSMAATLPPTATQVAATATENAPPTTPAAPTISPYLVYSRLDGSLWRADGPGRAPFQIAPPTEPNVILPWAASPDGRTIAYVSGTGLWDTSAQGVTPTLGLWMVGADGTNQREIVDMLPPSGVDTTPGGPDQDLIQALTNMQELAWSPDGSRVAFVSAHEDEVDLYTATADGKVTRLTQTDSLKKSPRWSPDGRMVACMTTSGFGTGAGWGNAGILVARADGGAPVRAVSDLKLGGDIPATFLGDLIWTGPDTLVAGMEAAPTGGVGVGMLTMSTGTWSLLLNAPEGDEIGLWWSAASTTLAIDVTPGNGEGTPIPSAAGLYVWQPGAAQATQVANVTVGPIALSPAQTIDPTGTVAWRPQGDMLAYSIVENSASLGVRVWRPGSKNSGITITNTPAQDIAWAPDGQRLAVDTGIYRVDGQKIDTLPEVNSLLGWGPQGLFYTTQNNGGESDESGTLWIWDGTQPQALDKMAAAFSWGRVVVPQP